MAVRSNLIKRVTYILQNHPETRDNDRELVIQFYKTYYPHEIDAAGKIRLEALADMTNPDDIIRYRADIQNKFGVFLSKRAENRLKRGHDDKYEAWVALSKNPTALQEALEKHRLAS